MSLRSLTSIHQVDVYVERVEKGESGGLMRPYGVPVQSGVKCRVKKLSANESQLLDKPEERATWRVYFSSDPNLTDQNKLLYTDTNGTKHWLFVKTVVNPHQMDRFWKVDCMDG